MASARPIRHGHALQVGNVVIEHPHPSPGDVEPSAPFEVGAAARLLGFAGLLPQAAFVALVAWGERDGALLAAIYALAILSFLGGIWWGLAMRMRAGQGQGQGLVAALAVVPSLVGVALAIALFATLGSGWVMVAIGVAILLTLPVDRWLAARGVAPSGWMRLRVPLSVGLGGLTIAAGALIGG